MGRGSGPGESAAETKRLVEARGDRCLPIRADVREFADCERRRLGGV
jgi:hypothetical protein